MGYEFWIDKLLLPVTPSSYELGHGNEIETVRATAIGDVNIKSHKRLQTVVLRGFFTVQNYPFATVGSYSTAIDYVNAVKRMVDGSRPVRLIITDGESTKINKLFYAAEITYSEDGTTGGDINYTITLREYRSIATESTGGRKLVRPQPTAPANPKTYTAVAGDYLCKIARKFYGNSDWKKLYEANKDVIGPNPNILYVGQVLRIP